MAFVEISGMKGKLFVPEVQDNKEKKYPCRDCYACQHCSDERCAFCLKRCGHLTNDDSKKC